MILKPELCFTDKLSLRHDVGGRIWAGIGKAAHKGKVLCVYVDTEVVKRGRMEDLKLVWENTEYCWWVGQVWIYKEVDGTEKGWRKIKRIFESERELGPADLDSEEDDS